MISITKTTTRPNTSVLWHSDPSLNIFTADFFTHLDLTYIMPGHLISQGNTFSEDGLVMTYTALWEDLTSYQQYDTDPVLQTFWDARNSYYATNGVVMSAIDVQEI